MSHISIDEMIDFIFTDSLDDSAIKMAAKINAHMAHCDTCWETYQKLLAASKAFDKIEYQVEKKQKVIQRLLEGFLEFRNAQGEGNNSVAACIAYLSKLKAVLRLRVENMYHLLCEQVSGEKTYYHPAFAVEAKSAGLDESADGRSTGVIQSTLVDGNKSRISVGFDRTLAAFFNKRECPANTLVILIPVRTDVGPYFEYTVGYDDSTVVARFEDIAPGEYIIAFLE